MITEKLLSRHGDMRLAAVLLAATAIKALLIYVIATQLEGVAFLYRLSGFADEYDVLAANLVQGHGYRFFPDTAPTLMREPGYPLILAGLFSVFGYSLAAAIAVNLLASFGIAWTVSRLAGQFANDSRIIVIGSSLLFLFHPSTITSELRGGPEIVFTLLLMLFIVSLGRALERGAWYQYFLTGMILGAACLVKGVLILFPLFLLAYQVVAQRKIKEPLRNFAILSIGLLLLLSPWIARNYLVAKAFVPTASVLGVSAHSGQYVCKNFSFDSQFATLDRAGAAERTALAASQGYRFREDYYQMFYTAKDELAFNNYLKDKVIEDYKKSPLLFAKCAVINFLRFWFTGKNWGVTISNTLIQIPFLALALYGVRWAARDRRIARLGPLLLLLCYYVAVHVPVAGQARYSVPLIPLLAVFAWIPLAHLITSHSARFYVQNFGIWRNSSRS